ncbi:ISL3 family transposase, partial [Marinobacter sp. R17]
MHANPLALFWEGFSVASFTQLGSQSLQIKLQPAADYIPCCSGCN